MKPFVFFPPGNDLSDILFIHSKLISAGHTDQHMDFHSQRFCILVQMS